MTAVSFPYGARKPLGTKLVFRNGLYPEAGRHSFVAEEANRIAFYCTKSWHFASPFQSVLAAGGASRTRWRTFIHTSKHCRYAYVRFLAMPSNNAGQPVSRVAFTLAGGGAPSATADFGYGGAVDDDSFDTLSIGQSRTADGYTLVDLDADTDYEVSVDEVDNARTLAVSIFEVGLKPDTDNGYATCSFSAGQPILDVHREQLTVLERNLWKRSAAPLITWSCDGDSDAYAATGTKNVIDGTSTTVTTATPGWTIDCRYRTTVRRASSGVPVIMRAYAKTAATTGAVYLKNSSGTILATCALSSSTASWVSSGAFYLPATLAKYDVHGAVLTGLGNTTVYAVALYSHEA